MSADGGCLALVVGPSGAGKDTLLRLAAAALRDDPRIVFPRRVVTREADSSEDHDTLDPDAFAAARAAGAFALDWEAHGLCYGIPAKSLAAGCVVACNVSRGIIASARRIHPNVRVVYVTAPQEILAARLAGRGRESGVAERLARKVEGDSTALADCVIDNSGEPETGGRALAAYLLSLAGNADAAPAMLTQASAP